MIKKALFLLLTALPLLSISQVNLNTQLPTSGLIQKEQLWNLVLINNSTDILDIALQLNLQDAVTGQVLLSATTGNVLLGKGVKVIKASDLQPIAYSFNQPDFTRSFLPLGSYVASYQVILADGRKTGILAEERIRIQIDPLSPPQLSSPANQSSLETPYPQFSWIPPTPFDMFNSLNYDFMITEVSNGQTPVESILYNTPVYSKTNLTHPFESYTSSFSKLDTGKLYAWQVIARNGLSYAAKTEVWAFKIAPVSWVKQLIEQTPFIKMRRSNPERGIAPNGFLKLSYLNETADSVTMVHIRNLNAPGESEIVFEQKLTAGENLIQKDLQKILKAKEGTIYEASIVNGRMEFWRLLFEVKKYNDKKEEKD